MFCTHAACAQDSIEEPIFIEMNMATSFSTNKPLKPLLSLYEQMHDDNLVCWRLYKDSYHQLLFKLKSNTMISSQLLTENIRQRPS
jgi:hypothetical protein